MSGFGGVSGGGADREQPLVAENALPFSYGFPSYGMGGYINYEPFGGTKKGFYLRTGGQSLFSTKSFSTTGTLNSPATLSLNYSKGFPILRTIDGNLGGATTTGLYGTVNLTFSAPNIPVETLAIYDNFSELFYDTSSPFSLARVTEIPTGAGATGFNVFPGLIFPAAIGKQSGASQLAGEPVFASYSPSLYINLSATGVTTGQLTVNANTTHTINAEVRYLSNITPADKYSP